MFSLLSHLRNRKSRVDNAGIHATIRNELAQEIVAVVPDLMELDADLQTARDQLETALQSEAFVGMRIQSYSTALQHQRTQLLFSHTTIDENGDTEQTLSEEQVRQREKLERDDEALLRAREHHAALVRHVGTLRTILAQLQRKRNSIAEMTDQVKEGLVGMMQVEDDDMESDMEDLEMQVELTVTEPNEHVTGSDEVTNEETFSSIDEQSVAEEELSRKEERIPTVEESQGKNG